MEIYFLTLAMIMAVVLSIWLSPDYGWSVFFTAAAAVCSMILHFQVNPDAEFTYIIHPEFFRKLTGLVMWGAFLYLFILGVSISFYQARLKEYVRNLEATVGAYEDPRTIEGSVDPE